MLVEVSLLILGNIIWKPIGYEPVRILDDIRLQPTAILTRTENVYHSFSTSSISIKSQTPDH